MDILEVFARISDEAKMLSLPEPVLMTDLHTGLLLRRIITDRLGLLADISCRTEEHVVAMYDGVKIVTPRWKAPSNA